MTANDRAIFIQDFIDTHCLPLLVTKGNEYSQGQEDVNSNFKRVAKGMDISQAKAAWVYAAKHWDAITNYIAKDGAVTLSEPIEGRLGDMANYIFILASILHEEKGL